jgi:hypothetical protein
MHLTEKTCGVYRRGFYGFERRSSLQVIRSVIREKEYSLS